MVIQNTIRDPAFIAACATGFHVGVLLLCGFPHVEILILDARGSSVGPKRWTSQKCPDICIGPIKNRMNPLDRRPRGIRPLAGFKGICTRNGKEGQ